MSPPFPWLSLAVGVVSIGAAAWRTTPGSASRLSPHHPHFSDPGWGEEDEPPEPEPPLRKPKWDPIADPDKRHFQDQMLRYEQDRRLRAAAFFGKKAQGKARR